MKSPQRTVIVKTKIKTRQEIMIDRERARGNIFIGHQEVSQQVVTVQCTVKTKIMTRQEMMIDKERARGNIFIGHQEVSQ